MSQPPWPQDPRNTAGSPYVPGYYAQSWDDGLGKSRAAGVMLFVVGALGILISFCLAGVGAMVQQVIESQPNFRQQMGGMQSDVIRVVMLVLAGCCILLSIGFIVLGVFVRRGGLVSTIIAIVLASLVELYCIVNLFASVGKLGVMQGPQLGGAACAIFVPPILVGGLLVLLISALSGSRRASAARAQQQAQMWQYQQTQQAYGQNAGYGYPAQPPPPPPQSPPEQQGPYGTPPAR